MSQENDMHLWTVLYDLLSYGPNPEPVMSSITSCLKYCTVFFEIHQNVLCNCRIM